MTDYTELKRLAEAAAKHGWYQAGSFGLSRITCEAEESFVVAASPAAVLALIAENERLRVDLKSVVHLNNENADLFKAENERLESEAVYSAAGFDAAHEEISKLRAEVAGLRTGYEAYERVNAELKAEVEALRKRIDDMLPFKGAPLTGPDTKCLACGGYHYGMGGLPCPNRRVTAQADLPETRSGQIGAAMGKGEKS